jgi:hypothetical protein
MRVSLLTWRRPILHAGVVPLVSYLPTYLYRGVVTILLDAALTACRRRALGAAP